MKLYVKCTTGSAESMLTAFKNKLATLEDIEVSGSCNTPVEAGLFDFGADEAKKYGNIIQENLGGQTISKRKDLANEPGGLIYEAKMLGIEDFYDLLKALEGMCADGRAREIDDSTYKVMPIKAAVNASEDLENKNIYQLIVYSSNPSAGIDGDEFECMGQFYAKDMDDAKLQLADAENLYPRFFAHADDYLDTYVEEYNEYFDTGRTYPSLDEMLVGEGYDLDPEYSPLDEIDSSDCIGDKELVDSSCAVTSATELTPSQEKQIYEIAAMYDDAQYADPLQSISDERDDIAKKLNITSDEAKDIMINLLGMSPDLFDEAYDPADVDIPEDVESDVWEEIDTKTVHDFDGFLTDYTLYHNLEDDTYACIFGDKDIYTPNDGDFDYECDSYDEAIEWFNSYSTDADDEM